jgi:hypothetical protein
MELAAWRLSPPAGIVDSVIESPPQDGFRIVFVEGKWQVPLHGDFIDVAEKAVWDGFSGLMKREGQDEQ